MNKLNVSKPTTDEPTLGLNLTEIETVKFSAQDKEWVIGIAVWVAGKRHQLELTYDEPSTADSPLFRLITAAENRQLKPWEFDGFDMDTLVKKQVVVGIVDKKIAGGKLVREVAIVLGTAEVKQFAPTLEAALPAAQPTAAN